MDIQSIKDHWKQWAETYNTDLRATTKTPTIKKLEIKSIYNAITAVSLAGSASLLEVGCGNGYNCVSLARLLPHFTFTGVDYIPEMVKHATELLAEDNSLSGKVKYLCGDILSLDEHNGLAGEYDIVFTNRCLINLPSNQLQMKGVDQLIKKVKTGGYLLLVENFAELRAQQNVLRKAVNLPERSVPEYNLFLQEERLCDHIKHNGMNLMSTSNFGSLHDIALYVLTPLINNGEIDYESDFVKVATQLMLSLPAEYENCFGSFGQNKLLLFKKDDGRQ